MRGIASLAASSLVLALAAAGCGGGGDAGEGAPPEPTTTAEAATTQPATSGDGEAAAEKGSSVKAGPSDYGKILFDGRGRALYLFTRESGSASRCYGACAAAWPPFLTAGEPQAGKGTRQDLLGTTKRRDGKAQVTYAGQPLYYYVGDREAGQVLCQDVEEFGGTWLVVSPGGSAVR